MDPNGVLFLILVVSAAALLMTAFGIKYTMPKGEKKGKVVNIKGEQYVCKPVDFKKAA